MKIYIAKPKTWFDKGTEVEAIWVDEAMGLFKGWRTCQNPEAEAQPLDHRYLDEEMCSLDEFIIKEEKDKKPKKPKKSKRGKSKKRTGTKGRRSSRKTVPDHPEHLAEGGKLQALAIRDAASVDTRNWHRFASFPIGEPLEVEWIDLDGIDAPADDLRTRGFLKGAARFARGEGMWTGDGAIWFACTAGGPRKAGQVWRYTPSPKEGRLLEKRKRGTLELFYESDDPAHVDMCDNVTVAPWGDVIVCEDGAGTDRLIGITPTGETYPLAENTASESELAGATFSPDGSTLFVNVQGSGATFAISGPWPSA